MFEINNVWICGNVELLNYGFLNVWFFICVFRIMWLCVVGFVVCVCVCGCVCNIWVCVVAEFTMCG